MENELTGYNELLVVEEELAKMGLNSQTTTCCGTGTCS